MNDENQLNINIPLSLKQKPLQKARDLARQFGVDRRTINQALYGPLSESVEIDDQFRWRLKNDVDPIDYAVDVGDMDDDPLLNL